MKKSMRLFILIALAAFAALGVMMFFPTERRGDPIVNYFLFYPTPPEENSALRGEEVWFTTNDGVRLNGRYYPAPAPTGYALYCHGNGGNLDEWQWEAEAIRGQTGLSILVFSYRGFGHSAGTPSAPGILQDGRAARDFLCAKSGLPAERLVYIGFSMGAAVAIDLAAETGARALIVDSGFASIPAMAQFMYHLPVRCFIRYPLDSAATIGAYRGPLLVIHGDADQTVPYEQGEQLFRAAPSERKQLLTYHGRDHGERDDAEHFAAINEFLRENP